MMYVIMLLVNVLMDVKIIGWSIGVMVGFSEYIYVFYKLLDVNMYFCKIE